MYNFLGPGDLNGEQNEALELTVYLVEKTDMNQIITKIRYKTE